MLVFSCIFCFKQTTAYEMRISDWSSDVCSSDLHAQTAQRAGRPVPLHADREQSDAHHGGLYLRSIDCARRLRALQGHHRARRKPRPHLALVPAPPPPAALRRRSSLLGRGRAFRQDRKSTRRTPVTNAHLVCRLLLEKKKYKQNN